MAGNSIGSIAPEAAIVTSQYPRLAVSSAGGLAELVTGTTDWSTSWRAHLEPNGVSALMDPTNLLSGLGANLIAQSRVLSPAPKCNQLSLRFLQRTNDGTWHTGDGLTGKSSKVYIAGIEEIVNAGVCEYIIDPLLAITVICGNKRAWTTGSGAQALQSRTLPDSATTANNVFWGAQATIAEDYTRGTGAAVLQAAAQYGRMMVEFDAQGYAAFLVTYVNNSNVVATGALLRGY